VNVQTRHDSGTEDLRSALFSPSRIALVGASSDPDKAASRPARFLRAATYPVNVSLVNRTTASTEDAPVFRSLLDLPVAPDHVFIMTPTSSVLETVEQCGELGVRVATILSGGFAEDGPVGIERQRQLLAAARRRGVRLLGPNSLGIVNLHNGLRLTGNAVFADESFPVGGTFVASQSGSLIGALASRGAAKDAGFAALVSVGGEADLSIGEVCSLALDDDAVTSYALFLESIRHGDELAVFAGAAAARGKPVVAYKLGASEAGAQLALSHTGALAGEDDVADAFLRDHQIARAHTLDGLLEGASLTRRVPVRDAGQGRQRVAVVTTTGGGAAMLVDQLSLRGVEVAGPTEATHARLVEHGVQVACSSIVDLTLAGTRYETMKSALDVLLDAPEFDLVIAVVGSSARTRPDLAVAPIVDSALAHRPLAVFLVPEAPAAAELLRTAAVPVFTSPETCADVTAAALGRRRRAAGILGTRLGAHSGAVVTRLDEAASYERLRSAGITCAPHVVRGVDAAPTAEEELSALRFPVAVKLLSAEVAHKSDLGGVVLSVQTAAEVAGVAQQMRSDLARHGVQIDRALVQEMVSGIGEFLVGYRVDHEVGPIVLLAAGGLNAEVYRDRSVRLAPVDTLTAAEMVNELASARLLDGYRNQPPGDRRALEHAVVALSRLAHDDTVIEAEINPLVVHETGRGATAVDAVVSTAQQPAAPGKEHS
jgi:acyl-CoA synthetase (NDP forming)